MAGNGAVLHHRSTSSQHLKKTGTVKQTRPTYTGRNYSSGHIVSASSKHSHGPIKSILKKEAVGSVDDDDDAAVAGAFLQYCTVCEKQIASPNSSILYCSERCRKQDSSSTHIHPSVNNFTPPPSPYDAFAAIDYPTHDIIPQRGPTLRRPGSGYMPGPMFDDEPLFDHHPPLHHIDSEAMRSLKQVFSTAPSSTALVPSRSHTSSSRSNSSDHISLPSLPHSLSSVSSFESSSPKAHRLPHLRNPLSSTTRPLSVELVLPFTFGNGPPTAPSSYSHPTSHLTTSASSTSLALKTQPLTQVTPTTSHGELRWCERHQCMHAPGALPGSPPASATGPGLAKSLWELDDEGGDATPRALNGVLSRAESYVSLAS